MKRLLGTGLIALAAGSCAPMVRELPSPPQRVYQNTYSFMPPAEPGWKVLVRGAHHLAFGRAGSNPDETYGIQGRVFGKLPAFSSSAEFVEIIRKGLAEQAADPRYKVLKHEVGAGSLPGATCARSHFVAEDHGAVKRDAAPGVMVLEVMTLSCAHPKNRDFAVTLVYSHRRYPQQADAAFAEQAQRVLSTLEFLE